MTPLVDDIGSFPFPVNSNREIFSKGYKAALDAIINGKDPTKDEIIQKNFCSLIIDSFRKKIATGLDVVNFPQHYDSTKQIGDIIHGAMEKGSFVVEQEKAIIPELNIINHEAKVLCEEFGKKIKLRVSIFGPFEQYLLEVGTTAYPDVLNEFAETINRFAKNSIINNKYIETKVVSIDEPSFGHNNLLATSDLICKTLEKAFDFQGPIKQIHLHTTSGMHDLLKVKGIDVLSFEYAASPKNIEVVPKSMLEKADKQIRVGIVRTDIDDIWAQLYEKGITQPSIYQLVETEDVIRKRYLFAKEKYEERMTFTGPDCGLGSWPSQEAAELLLKLTVSAVKKA
jgi:5-methyltetrahydropteroyltriglutamate--homocysteine methyltransferase